MRNDMEKYFTRTPGYKAGIKIIAFTYTNKTMH